MVPTPSPVGSDEPDRARHAEAALRRLGFARIPAPGASRGAEFWVQEAGVPRRRFPVYMGPWTKGTPAPAKDDSFPARAIVVVPSESAAETAWEQARSAPGSSLDSEVAVLVVPPRAGPETAPHWHARTLPPREVLQLATGIVVGLFRRAAADDGGGGIDFSELIRILRTRFMVDVPRSLGVEDDEESLFMLYHLAQKLTWAPGDGGANLHAIVLKPTGPAARLPWFAA